MIKTPPDTPSHPDSLQWYQLPGTKCETRNETKNTLNKTNSANKSKTFKHKTYAGWQINLMSNILQNERNQHENRYEPVNLQQNYEIKKMLKNLNPKAKKKQNIWN